MERRGSQLREPLGLAHWVGLAEGRQVGGQAVLENPREANSFHDLFTYTRATCDWGGATKEDGPAPQ